MSWCSDREWGVKNIMMDIWYLMMDIWISLLYKNQSIRPDWQKFIVVGDMFSQYVILYYMYDRKMSKKKIKFHTLMNSYSSLQLRTETLRPRSLMRPDTMYSLKMSKIWIFNLDLISVSKLYKISFSDVLVYNYQICTNPNHLLQWRIECCNIIRCTGGIEHGW